MGNMHDRIVGYNLLILLAKMNIKSAMFKTEVMRRYARGKFTFNERGFITAISISYDKYGRVR